MELNIHTGGQVCQRKSLWEDRNAPNLALQHLNTHTHSKVHSVKVGVNFKDQHSSKNNQALVFGFGEVQEHWLFVMIG
jgi:hypothetical protein